jgi:hypothetical protein
MKKSDRRLTRAVALLMASLIAVVLVANSFVSTKTPPNAKIRTEGPTEATSRAMGTASSPFAESLPVPARSLPAPARREAGKNPLFTPVAPATQSGEAIVREAVRDADVTEANAAVSTENGPLAFSRANNLRTRAQQGPASRDMAQQNSGADDLGDVTNRKPIEAKLQKASRSFSGDVRDLPYEKLVEREMPEHEDPEIIRRVIGEPADGGNKVETTAPILTPAVAAPPPLNVFEGLDRFNWGAGSPPDTNGDVGPNNYIQTVNTSIGIFNKTTGNRDAAFTFNTFMSQGAFGNLCDTNNFGDPVVLYDTFEDRWIITDFAFLTDISGNVLSPSYQCFAASKTADPILGGWNFYSIQISDALNDYPKLGIWPDGLYMSANMFSFGAGSTFQTARVWAFNKAQMYAGAPTVQNVSFNVGGGDFTVIPSNARLQTGTPPLGTPNYFLSTELFLNALTIYKFHVDWARTSLSTFTGPDTPLAATSWPNANVANAAQPGTTTILDVLQIRAMVQNQYTNFAGTESLWTPHTVRRGNTSGFAAPRWYQVNVTGGTVNANLPQATTWDPDGANVVNRFMPSLALDRAGNMALGYSTSNGTTEFPSIKYAGRLSTDPVNTFSLTEQVLFTGTASQTGVTNPPSTTRWGDYSAMTLDPNGCTFWYTNEYANPADQTFNHRWLTKFGSFQFSPCTTVGAGGTLQGTVTDSVTTNPINGATISFGSRSTTTNGSGFYSFTPLPAGTYPTETASAGGHNPSTTNTIVVNDSGTTVKDFALAPMSAGGCPVDTTQADFQLGVGTAVDLTTNPNDVTLSNTPVLDQQNTAGTSTGTGFGTPNWTGQTFIPAVTGLLARVDIPLFCNGCTGTTPNLTLSVRGTSGGLPTGADLASATIPGFSNGSVTTNLSVVFGSPAALTSGTQYALILRPTANPSVGGYFWIRSSPSTYANGSRVTSADSGATWATDTTRDFNFKTYMQTGYAAAGNLVSGLKDNNPGGGFFSHWTTFSWTASTPANTSITFQVAGSNSQYGPFNFIGPDGTAGTFFNSPGADLYPLLGNVRYMKYKAYLATTNSAATPTLNDVTTCYSNTNAPTAANGNIGGTITDGNGSPVSGVTINLSGTQSREAITDANGRYSFDSVETNGFYTVTPSRANYTFTPANRSFSLLAVHTEASFMATANNGRLNPLDTNEYFVRQHYLDFLNREPDGPGLAGWVSTLNNCAAGDTSCDRVHVSEAFYRSPEFQERGYFAYRFYATALGRKPDYAEFAPDLARVSGFLTNDQLEAAKTAFIDDFVARPAFARQYDSLSDTAFVDKLLQTSGVDLSSSRQGLVDALSTRRLNRAAVLREIAESGAVYQKYYNQAFVVMEYFGYLHRDPDALYTDWIRTLDANPADSRRMVDGFVNSTEYRNRFAP